MSALNRSERRYWFRFLLLLVFIYLAVTAIIWCVADSMMFFPQYASRAEPPGMLYLRSKDGGRLGMVHLRNPQARFTIWYFHGNAEAIGEIMPRLVELHDLGFSVFAVEYPGYGTSDGSPSESTIYASFEPALDYLHREGVRAESLVIFGRSLGSGPALELANRLPVAGLMLESAFLSAYRVTTRWPIFFGDRFNNARKIREVKCPTLIIHGRDDRIIPFYHGERLFAASAATVKRNLWIEFGGHNDLRSLPDQAYRNVLAEFRASLVDRN